MVQADYSKTVLYYLACRDPSITEKYVGSTTNARLRKNRHKSNCNNPNTTGYNSKVYQFIRNTGGFDNWDLIVIEDFPCSSKNEAHKRERHWLEFYKAELNSIHPIRYAGEKEEQIKLYKQQNKEQLKEQRKVYYQQNQEQLKEQQKVYYQQNQEQRKEQQKVYRQQNKEQRKEQQKIYYQQNKEQLKIKRQERRCSI